MVAQPSLAVHPSALFNAILPSPSIAKGKKFDHTTECEKMSDHMSGSYIEDRSAGGQQRTPSDPLDIFRSGNELPSMRNVLNQPSLNISLSAETKTRMTRSILDIFDLEEEPLNEDVEMVEDDEEEPVVDLEDQRRRTDRLRGVLPALAQLWWSDSDETDLVAEKLGDGSRDRKLCSFRNTVHHSSFVAPSHVLFLWSTKASNCSPVLLSITTLFYHTYPLHLKSDKLLAKWRIPLGDSGVLDFFLDILKGHDLRYTLKIHVLRLIGNSCADTGKKAHQSSSHGRG
jgi:hypothetical protein